MTDTLTTTSGSTLDAPRYGEMVEIRLGAKRRLTPSQFAAAKSDAVKAGATYHDGVWTTTLTAGRCDWAIAALIRRGDAVVTYA